MSFVMSPPPGISLEQSTTTSLRRSPSSSLEYLTPGSSGSSSTSNHFAKRMGEASSFISSDNSKSVDRMDLGSSADRLSAQVKAISVLNTVRAMQDEIKDINQQIEKENSMLAETTTEARNDLQSQLTRLAFEMGKSNSAAQVDPGLLLTGDSLSVTTPNTQPSSIDLGDALKILADKRQKLESSQRIIEEARLRQAEDTLQRDQKIQQEKNRLIASIEDNRRSELRRAKQRAKAKVRQQMIGRLQKQKALSAHKSLIEASNQKIISRIEQLKTQRQAAAQLRTKQAIQQQLSKGFDNTDRIDVNKLNAVKLLQQKKLANLRKQQNSPLLQAVEIASPLTKLTPNEKLQMLSWLDLERNSEILAATDKKIKDKMRSKKQTDKLVQKAAAQVLADYDDYYDYDDLTDAEIDEILLTITGQGSAAPVEDDLYDELLEDYVDDVDLLDILGDYDVGPVAPVAPVAAPVIPGVGAAVVPGLGPTHIPPHGVGAGAPHVVSGVAQHAVIQQNPAVFTHIGAHPVTPSPIFHQQVATPTPFHQPAGFHHPVSPVAPSASPFPPTHVTATSPYAPVTPAPNYHPHPHSTPKPYYPPSNVDPWPNPSPAPPPYHHGHHGHPTPVTKPPHHTVTHYHIPVKPKPTPRPTPYPNHGGNVQFHHHDHDHHEEYHYPVTPVTPKPKPYHHHRPTIKPFYSKVHYKEYSLPPGPPYPLKYDNYDGDYDYEYYDSYDPPPVHFDPHKIGKYPHGGHHYTTQPPSYKSNYGPPLAPPHSTYGPPPSKSTYGPPPTPKPYYTSTQPPPYEPSYYHKPEPYYSPEPYYDHHPVHHGHQRYHGPTDNHFLDGVSAILQGATSGVVHPHDVGSIVGSTVLGNIQDKVRSELNIGPPDDGAFSDIRVGTTPPPSSLPHHPPSTPLPFLPGFEPRVDVNPRSEPIKRKIVYNDGYALGSSNVDQPENTKQISKPPPNKLQKKNYRKVQSPPPDGQLSFSELMSDFFSNKPLPFKAAQKSRHLDGKSPPHGK